MRSSLRSVIVCSLLCSAGLLAGCSNNFDPIQGETLSSSAVTMSGEVYGGFFPVSGAHVFLFSPGVGVPGTASSSLITHTSSGATQDTTTGSITNGAYYVTTAANGAFTFTSTCTVGTQVYLYASNGVATTGGANNPQIGLMAVVGTCPSTGTVDALPFIRITENTTVAAAYALSGFGNDPGHLSTSGSPLALAGVANAVATANNLFNDQIAVASTSASTGFPATTTTASSTGTLPQTLLNTLSNILVACVNSGNSASATTTGCNTLRENATSDGATGTGPTAPAVGTFSSDAPNDTATAMMNIAHHPFAGLSNLFGLQGMGAAAVYKPALSAVPASFVVEVQYTGGGINTGPDLVPKQIAIDGTGNVWIANERNTISKFSPLGVPLSGTTGYVPSGCPGLSTTVNSDTPSVVAIDSAGDAWIGFENGANQICELNPTGGLVFALSVGAADNGFDGVADIAFDASGNAWIAESEANGDVGSLIEVNPSSHATSTFTGNGIASPYGIAIQAAAHTGDIWLANFNGGDSAFTSSGAAASFSPVSNGSAGAYPYGATGIAIDASGFVWSLSFPGVTRTPQTGGSGSYYNYPSINNEISIAMDGASNAWIVNSDTVNSTNNMSVITELNNSGALLTPAAGFKPAGTSQQGGDRALNIAIDGSGNVWYNMTADNTLRQLVGAAVPVATPLAYGTANNKLGARP